MGPIILMFSSSSFDFFLSAQNPNYGGLLPYASHPPTENRIPCPAWFRKLFVRSAGGMVGCLVGIQVQDGCLVAKPLHHTKADSLCALCKDLCPTVSCPTVYMYVSAHTSPPFLLSAHFFNFSLSFLLPSLTLPLTMICTVGAESISRVESISPE